MKRWLCAALAVICLLALCGCSKTEEETRWDCSVGCAAESTEDSYIITWSEAEVTAKTGVLTFQNRNDFVVTVHLAGGGKEVFIEEIQPGGLCVWLQADKETVYTVGLHADVEENTEIRMMVYDGNQADPF